MEQLFGGNYVILLFWVYVTFIIEIKEKYKKIILIYLLTYITNILEIVPTIQSYLVLLLALFMEIEFWEDKFKIQIVNHLWEKILDFFYLMFSQYALVSYTIALILSSKTFGNFIGNYYIIVQIISGLVVYFSCRNVACEKYKVCSFTRMKEQMDDIASYRTFLQNEECIVDETVVLSIEDNSFYDRGERYTLLNKYYLKKKYLTKIMQLLRRFRGSSNKVTSLKRFLRGYSTIEMQLLRTLAIEEGYSCIFRRKIFECLYARLFLKNLRKYYIRCECKVEPFKDYLLYLYLRIAPCLNRGGEECIEKVMRERKQIEKFSREELFVLTLCFSGKIKRLDILDVYEDIILKLNLDKEILETLALQLNRY